MCGGLDTESRTWEVVRTRGGGDLEIKHILVGGGLYNAEWDTWTVR